MVKKEPVELSEYEKQRQANIAQRDNLLKQLALYAAPAGLGPSQSLSNQTIAPLHTRKADPSSESRKRFNQEELRLD